LENLRYRFGHSKQLKRIVRVKQGRNPVSGVPFGLGSFVLFRALWDCGHKTCSDWCVCEWPLATRQTKVCGWTLNIYPCVKWNIWRAQFIVAFCVMSHFPVSFFAACACSCQTRRLRVGNRDWIANMAAVSFGACKERLVGRLVTSFTHRWWADVPWDC